MLLGAIGAIVFTALFALRATESHTSFGTFAVLLTLIAVCLGVAFAPWLAGFTETVERRNPAVTATGLSVWGLINRTVVALTVFLLPHVVTTVTTLAQDGPLVKAAVTGTDPTLTAAQNAAVKAVAADPGIGVKVKSLAATYAPQLATAAKLTTATNAALAADPTSVAARGQALAEISGLPPTTVARVITLARSDAALPPGDLAFLAANGPKVQAAVDQLAALSKVPAADRAFLARYGTPLQDPKVLASLAYLKAHAPAVKQAKADSPGQWQNFFWVAVGGQLVFIPLVFLMAGFWDPRKAREQQLQHEEWVNAELAKLQLDLQATNS